MLMAAALEICERDFGKNKTASQSYDRSLRTLSTRLKPFHVIAKPLKTSVLMKDTVKLFFTIRHSA
jgi:hypothetical protein